MKVLLEFFENQFGDVVRRYRRLHRLQITIGDDEVVGRLFPHVFDELLGALAGLADKDPVLCRTADNLLFLDRRIFRRGLHNFLVVYAGRFLELVVGVKENLLKILLLGGNGKAMRRRPEDDGGQAQQAVRVCTKSHFGTLSTRDAITATPTMRA